MKKLEIEIHPDAMASLDDIPLPESVMKKVSAILSTLIIRECTIHSIGEVCEVDIEDPSVTAPDWGGMFSM